MKRLAIICLLMTFTLTPYAQQKRTKSAAKTAQTGKTGKASPKKKSGKASGKGSKGAATTTSVQALENQRKRIQEKIKEQERLLQNSQRDVKKRLQTLMMLNTEIAGKRRVIDTIRHDISNLDIEIEQQTIQLELLQEELTACKKRYVKSMRYMHRNRSSQSQLMFVFSADNFAQMMRRMRFMREYAAYQHVQGDEVKSQQEAVNMKFLELSNAKSQKTQLLAKGERERRELEGKQTEQQNVVKTLQKEQKTIQNIIAQQKKKDAALNAQIDRLIAEEIARQKARAAAEAKRRAEAEAAKKRQAELARKKAEAEAAARENARRIREAREREERAKAEAQAAKNKEEKEAAERRAREAEENRLAEERRAEKESREHAREVAAARKGAEEALQAPSEDRRISGNFESNRGRLPMPITGAYRVVSHFGQYDVEGLRNVKLDNKGVNIKGEAGSFARSIFDGEVSAVFSFAGTMVVMVRHGSYISVYCNLSSVNVHRGQKVTARQSLGRIGSDNILHFQLRRGTDKLNPEAWLGR